MDLTPPASEGTYPAPREALRIPEYELLRRVGRGSYGEVWLARSAGGLWRAVKIVHRSDFDSDRPFQRELAGLMYFEPHSHKHSGLVDLLHLGMGPNGESFYYIMELADDAGGSSAPAQVSPTAACPPAPGKEGAIASAARRGWPEYRPLTLESLLETRGRLPAADCVAHALTLTDAVRYLHEQGLVHRDIKPSNVVFVGGVPKLADPGTVARAQRARSRIGTEGYAPPEGPGTPQADLYSLGKVLYQMATGKDRQAFPDPPTGLCEQPDRKLWAELNAVVTKASAPKAGQRYARAADMLAELWLIEQGGSVLHRRRRQQRRRWAGRSALAALLLAGACVPGWRWWTHRPLPFVPAAQSAAETPGFDIVFESNRSGARHIWRMRADGSEARPLTSEGMENVMPCPAPDGRHIAYVRLMPDLTAQELRVVDAEGREDRLVLRVPGARPLFARGWTPNGQGLIYSKSDAPGRTGIWAVGLHGEAPRLWLEPAAVGSSNVTEFCVSAVGTKVAWIAQPANNSPDAEVFAADWNEAGLVPGSILRLTTNAVLEAWLALSPDGRRAAFGRSTNPNGHGPPYVGLVKEVAPGGAERFLTTRLAARGVLIADWSPGPRILLAGFGRGNEEPEVFSVRPDGTAPAQLTRTRDSNLHPRWLRR